MLPPPAWADRYKNQSAQKQIDRIVLESRALIKTIIAERIKDLETCIFSNKWSSRSIDMLTAQKYLKSNTHADVVGVEIATPPADVIDPSKNMSANFCQDNDADALWKRKKEAFKTAGLPSEGSRDVPSVSLKRLRVDFSFPIFDKHFTTAAIFITYDNDEFRKGSPESVKKYPELYDEVGYPKRRSGELFCYSYIYRKKGKKWRLFVRDGEFSATF